MTIDNYKAIAVAINSLRYHPNLSDLEIQSYELALGEIRDHMTQQEAEKNEPLTLEELKEMEGQPVFWESLIASHCGEWRILNHFGEKMEYLDFSGKSPEMLCNYGKWYVCYRHPPKEAHNV